MITNKELKQSSYYGRCKYFWNNKVIKKCLDTRRTVLKRDTQKEVKINM